MQGWRPAMLARTLLQFLLRPSSPYCRRGSATSLPLPSREHCVQHTVRRPCAISLHRPVLCGAKGRPIHTLRAQFLQFTQYIQRILLMKRLFRDVAHQSPLLDPSERSAPSPRALHYRKLRFYPAVAPVHIIQQLATLIPLSTRSERHRELPASK